MSLMFWGTIIGLVPILISFIVGNLMPTVSMPGEDYMFLTMALNVSRLLMVLSPPSLRKVLSHGFRVTRNVKTFKTEVEDQG